MQLVYDVGGYDGADTARYLDMGFRVLCIEAAPTLAAKIRARFEGNERCTVLNVAVGEKDGTLPFYVYPDSGGELNSFQKRPGSKEINVPVRTLRSILAEFGVPYFLKVDIEGADRHAILPLTKETTPQFISFEAGNRDLDLILHLWSIGYRRFNIIRQDVHEPITMPELGTTRHVAWSARQAFRLWLRSHNRLHAMARKVRSGKTGQSAGGGAGAPPMEVKEGWRDADRMLHDWVGLTRSGIIDSAWFDVHAAL
jgi:FkbM family methyltransferase